MVNWWIACIYHNNGVHFHFMKILMCYVMDLKLIDVINVSYMFYRSYLLQILHAFSKELNERKTEKQRIVDSDGKWRPCWLYGDGMWGGQNILPYIIDLLGPFREIWEYAREISGNSQGEKMCQSVGILLEFPLVQFYGAGTVWSVLQLVSHIYSNKPNCC